MLPIYFADSGKALFGIYHPPRRARARPVTVVLCNPVGHEYVGAHRTIRVLAEALAESGASVLRFDYFGTGDSAGAAVDANVAQWLEDINAAVDEAKGTSGAERTALVGIRLGATLAAMAAASRSDIDRIVLWEPVLSGREHVAEHLARHDRWLKLGKCRVADSTDEEALGFPLTRALKEQIEQLDLLHSTGTRIREALLLFHSNERRERANALTELARHCETTAVEAPDFWFGRLAFDQPLVSKSNVQLVVDWLTREGE